MGPLCSMELMELMAMASPMPDMAMEPTPMPTTERGLLTLSPRLMPMLTTMELMVLVMLDTAMVLAMPDMLLPMVAMPTMERGLLTPSPRPMLLFSMELMAMVDMVLAMPDMVMLLPTPMVPTPMPTDMASKK